MNGRRRTALILILIVDVGCILWGGMAAFWLDHLMGPHGLPILPAGYEGYTGASWTAMATASPATAGYMEVLYRTYGMYNVALGLMLCWIALTAFRRGERWAWWALLVGNTIALGSAIIYDRTVNAIGLFEMSEYLGLAMIWIACALTARGAKTGNRELGTESLVLQAGNR